MSLRKTDEADVYNLLGYTLCKAGDYSASLAYYTKALDLPPYRKAAPGVPRRPLR
jgi:Tfp pilus assembly protein PilF